MILDSKIAAKVGISRQTVRNYRLAKTQPRKRKRQYKYAAAIEAAEQELINELLQRITNGKDKRNSRKPENEPAPVST